MFQLYSQISQFLGMSGIVTDHILHQRHQFFHGGVLAGSTAAAAAAFAAVGVLMMVMPVVMIVMMMVVMVMQMLMAVGMLMVMGVGVNMLVGMGMTIVCMLMGMSMVVIVMMHRVSPLIFLLLYLWIYGMSKLFFCRKSGKTRQENLPGIFYVWGSSGLGAFLTFRFRRLRRRRITARVMMAAQRISWGE